MAETTDPTNVHETLKKLKVPVDGLVHYDRNPRRGDLSLIMESLETHGQYKPVVVRTGTNEILAGNHTVMATKELGWTQVAATFVDVDDDEAARIVLVDNRANDKAGYDDAELAELLQAVDANEQGLAGTGFVQEDLQGLLSALEDAGEEDWDTAMDALPDEDPDLASRTYHFSRVQAETVDSAVQRMQQAREFADSGQVSGAALVAICEEWMEQMGAGDS